MSKRGTSVRRAIGESMSADQWCKALGHELEPVITGLGGAVVPIAFTDLQEDANGYVNVFTGASVETLSGDTVAVFADADAVRTYCQPWENQLRPAGSRLVDRSAPLDVAVGPLIGEAELSLCVDGSYRRNHRPAARRPMGAVKVRTRTSGDYTTNAGRSVSVRSLMSDGITKTHAARMVDLGMSEYGAQGTGPYLQSGPTAPHYGEVCAVWEVKEETCTAVRAIGPVDGHPIGGQVVEVWDYAAAYVAAAGEELERPIKPKRGELRGREVADALRGRANLPAPDGAYLVPDDSAPQLWPNGAPYTLADGSQGSYVVAPLRVLQKAAAAASAAVRQIGEKPRTKAEQKTAERAAAKRAAIETLGELSLKAAAASAAVWDSATDDERRPFTMRIGLPASANFVTVRTHLGKSGTIDAAIDAAASGADRRKRERAIVARVDVAGPWGQND